MRIRFCSNWGHITMNVNVHEVGINDRVNRQNKTNKAKAKVDCSKRTENLVPSAYISNIYIAYITDSFQNTDKLNVIKIILASLYNLGYCHCFCYATFFYEKGFAE